MRRILRPMCRGFHATPGKCIKVGGRAPGLAKRLAKPPSQLQKSSDYLPPIVLLNSARKSGALDIDAKKAVDLLREYFEALQNPSPGWEKRLCQSHNVTPQTLSLLGMIMRRCPRNSQKYLANRLMTTASEMGDNRATFELVSSALRTGTIDRNSGPAKRCKSLAEHGDPQAMLLLGKMLLNQGLASEALPWFSKARCPETLNGTVRADALVQEGLVLRASNDEDAARSAFAKAALELDDPSAYFYLSEFESSKESEYLLKAASGGVTAACHKLGLIELMKVGAAKSLSDFGMAREWFEVASADGYGLSMIQMASICKASGEIAKGRLWLDSAETSPVAREEARSLKREWAQ